MPIEYPEDVDGLFVDFGRAATYTPTVGAPVAVVLILTLGDASKEYAGIGTVGPARIASVRQSQVAAPVVGDTFTMAADGFPEAGETFRVQGPPRVDPLGAIWQLDCAKV